jgi:hypothetical protein
MLGLELGECQSALKPSGDLPVEVRRLVATFAKRGVGAEEVKSSYLADLNSLQNFVGHGLWLDLEGR